MFQGYTQETVDFMWGIRFNNERGWFLEHKQQYQTQLLEPTRALGEQVYEGVQAMLPREAADAENKPHLPGCPAAFRPGTLQGPPVVLRAHRG